MRLLSLPWLDFALAMALAGALCVSRLRNPDRAFRWGLVLTGAVFVCTFLAWLEFYLSAAIHASWSLQSLLFGRQVLVMDELSRPALAGRGTIALSDDGGDGANEDAAFLGVLVIGRQAARPGDLRL